MIEDTVCARTVNARKAKNYVRSKLLTIVRQQTLVTRNEGFFIDITSCIRGLHRTRKLLYRPFRARKRLTVDCSAKARAKVVEEDRKAQSVPTRMIIGKQ